MLHALVAHLGLEFFSDQLTLDGTDIKAVADNFNAQDRQIF